LYEDIAKDFLTEKGFVLVEQNFHCKLGEIDLIMMDGDTLVFIEVRFRKPSRFGESIETIHITKQKKLINTANFYLTKHKRHNQQPCRFDVVAITGNDIHWVKNAFD